MAEKKPAPLLILISAPSGGGKTTLCQELLAARPDMTRAVTCTTRAPRPGEQDGVDYYFLQAGDFLKRVQAGNFLEHATVYGNSYGLLKAELLGKLRQGKDVLLNVDVQGAATIREKAQDELELKGALVKMREREGAHLAKDLSARTGVMSAAVGKIQKQAPVTAENYRQNLLERIKSAGIENIAPDDERLLKEIVLFADRSDISEELTRLQSHFQQFADCCKSKEPVGRTLDFLAQEMNREINTIGSKANDAVISREVVTLKAELEKFREQAMNVE